jgi:hypothetical protein
MSGPGRSGGARLTCTSPPSPQADAEYCQAIRRADEALMLNDEET